MFLTAFNAGAAGSQNIATLIVLRFLAGSFGSSPLTNAGGVIADMFPAAQRGLAMSIFAAAPFLGPVIGPIGEFTAPWILAAILLTSISRWLRWSDCWVALDRRRHGHLHRRSLDLLRFYRTRDIRSRTSPETCREVVQAYE